MIDLLKRLYASAGKNIDPRVRNYPLINDGPGQVLMLAAGYLVFAILGPRVMKHFPAVNVPAFILFAYNFGLSLLSLYIVVQLIVGVYESKYDLMCAKINNRKAEIRVVNAIWWYFFSKAIEFMDTFWMIIRKRFNQVTFLHVFHHSTMLLLWWMGSAWLPGGQAYFGATLNSIVHVVMYLYYALSVIPSLKDKLWWKKYITVMQLIQFIIVFIHTSFSLATGCDFPLWPQWCLFFYLIMMLGLFGNFYMQEYIKKSNERKRRKQREEINNGSANQEKKKDQ